MVRIDLRKCFNARSSGIRALCDNKAICLTHTSPPGRMRQLALWHSHWVYPCQGFSLQQQQLRTILAMNGGILQLRVGNNIYRTRNLLSRHPHAPTNQVPSRPKWVPCKVTRKVLSRSATSNSHQSSCKGHPDLIPVILGWGMVVSAAPGVLRTGREDTVAAAGRHEES